MSGYEDVINLPRHVSERHARMSMLDRAAQFSPFAALPGYDSAIKEAAKLTDSRIELDADEKEILDKKLREAAEKKLPVRVTFFREDEKKSGGFYVSAEGKISKINPIEGKVSIENREMIMVENIIEITRLSDRT